MLRAKPRQRLRQHVVRRHRQRREVQRATPQPAQVVERAPRILHVADDAPRIRQQQLTCGRQPAQAPRPVEKWRADRLLQLPDLVRERGLFQTDDRRRARESARVGHRHEVAQMSQFDRIV